MVGRLTSIGSWCSYTNLGVESDCGSGEEMTPYKGAAEHFKEYFNAQPTETRFSVLSLVTASRWTLVDHFRNESLALLRTTQGFQSASQNPSLEDLLCPTKTPPHLYLDLLKCFEGDLDHAELTLRKWGCSLTVEPDSVWGTLRPNKAKISVLDDCLGEMRHKEHRGNRTVDEKDSELNELVDAVDLTEKKKYTQDDCFVLTRYDGYPRIFEFDETDFDV